ncbi:TBC1 domain family member 13 protein [Achlya hypogyna]|uniref:TBC1 domain family member 13 protein n=1 Tax=Achlya hypogyna TaxID=1202772 RepID=A0A1V9Z0G2_ACHHY|nr:TBC1 domain family member 13 protein [Achlya hypogyna]
MPLMLHVKSLPEEETPERRSPPAPTKAVSTVLSLLDTTSVFNMERLQEIVFQGLDEEPAVRPIAWRLLLGVLGNRPATWTTDLAGKRQVYEGLQEQFLPPPPEDALFKDIQKDAARTHVQLSNEGIEWMLHILYIFANVHPEVGYTQGMHEALAPIIYVFNIDDAAEWQAHGEADAFAAFETLMQALAPLHLPSKSAPSKTGVQVQMARLNTLLRQHDARLWQHLNSVALTPEYYSFRWYITLFSREFPIGATLRIWDSLLADKRRFAFLHYVCVAMIISHRVTLLHRDADFGSCLTILQSQPCTSATALLEDARKLRDVDRAADTLARQRLEARRAMAAEPRSGPSIRRVASPTHRV